LCHSIPYTGLQQRSLIFHIKHVLGAKRFIGCLHKTKILIFDGYYTLLVKGMSTFFFKNIQYPILDIGVLLGNWVGHFFFCCFES
jgi:hypothetical protein